MKRISLILIVCLLACMFPGMAFADYSYEGGSNTYTAIGDSICAGFAQLDYEYIKGFDMMENIENSPRLCYARLVGDVTASKVYNLGKCGCDSGELLDILTGKDPIYSSVYKEHIAQSSLISVGIGSNDMIMATAHSILKCIGQDFSEMTNQEVLAIVEPLLTGNIPGIINSLELLKGIRLTPEQIKAIQLALSDESMTAVMEKAYEAFCINYPQILSKIHEINPTATLIVLNYYNPYKQAKFKWNGISNNTQDIIQETIDKMNEYTLKYSREKGYLYADVSKTLTNIIDPHPSAIGHFQIASKIIEVLYKNNI